MIRRRLIASAAVLAALLAPALRAGDFDAGAAKFSVKVGDNVFPHEIASLFVMPQEEVVFEIAQGPHADYDWDPDDDMARLAPGKWRWRAPALPGLYRFKVSNKTLQESIRFHVFVMVPRSRMRGEYLNGYRIGRYPSRPLGNNPLYRPPPGFVEVTADNRDTRVSPHFTLEQFLAKQQHTGYPRYLVLEERLLLMLEVLLESANAQGHEADTFFVMSGYRTPFYNKALGDVAYSMHQWGNAADIWIDDDGDGLIDDLNRDRKITYRDAAVLHAVADRLQRSGAKGTTPGGLGLYTSTPAHGPFVHVDVRGRLARWDHIRLPEVAPRPLAAAKKRARSQTAAASATR